MIALDLGLSGLAFLNFVPQDGTLGTNQKRPGKADTFDLWYWMSSWPHFVDMLHNEKPVFFIFNDVLKAAIVKTTPEPVGEEETSS